MPQPVDMQTELARTLLAERLGDGMRASLQGLHRTQIEAERERLRVETEIRESARTEAEAVKTDQRERDNEGSRRRRRRRHDSAATVVYNAESQTERIGDSPNLDVDA